MDDLISRQDAIDAICKACSMDEDYHKCDGYPETSTWCDELVALKSLPSADVTEAVRCKDCKHFDGEKTWCHQDIYVPFDHFYCYYGERKEE